MTERTIGGRSAERPATTSSDNSSSEQPVRQSAKSYFGLHGCRIERDQLDRIWQLAREDFSPKAHVVVSTKRKADGIEFEIEGRSIDDLLDGVRKATFPGDPNYVDNLRLYISEGISSRSASIYVDAVKGEHDEGVRVFVEDADPGWVRGRSGGLKGLLTQTQSHRLTGRGHSRPALAVLGAALGVGLVAGLVGPVLGNASTALFFLVVLGILVAVPACGYMVGIPIDRRAQTQLRLLNERISRKVDWVNICILAVGMLGLIAAVVGIVIAHLDTVKTH